MPFLPCILCGKKLDQRTDKNGKPYFTCDPCGTQFFVRRKQGMEKLVELIRELEKRGLAITQRAQSLYEVQAILSEIDGLKSEIEKLDAQIWFLFVDEDKVQARKSLKTRVQGLLMELEEISKRPS
jgi:DNA-directed RNA polymerase subunit RPC12/RpoP